MVYISRGKNKVQLDYGIGDIYKYYKNHAKDPVDYDKFRDLWKQLSDTIIKLILFRNLDFNLPARLGILCARKIKAVPKVREDGSVDKNKLGVDYKASWKKWFKEYPGLSVKQIAKVKNKVPVYHINEHTDGYKSRWKWDRFTCTVKNQAIYKLDMTRDNKKKLSNAFKDPKIDYYENDRR